MNNNAAILPSGDVIESFKIKELNMRNLTDFLPNIRPGNEWDTEVLRSWCDHFRSAGVPYLVVKINGRLKLYKELRTDY